jgi:hypothetical protein
MNTFTLCSLTTNERLFDPPAVYGNMFGEYVLMGNRKALLIPVLEYFD